MSEPIFYIPANNIRTTVVGSYTAGSRSLNVLDGSGIVPAGGRPVRVTVVRQSDNAFVIYRVSAVVDHTTYYTLTVDPIEGTTDLNFVNNDRVDMRITAGALEDIHDAIGDLYTTISGNFGPQGVQGEAGPIGVTGATGAGGPQGFMGVQGVQGLTGPQGFMGAQGVQGFQGVQGQASNVVGPQGIRGFQGSIGATGPQGITGVQGIQGEKGYQGDPGGPQGILGLQGVQGYQGEAGIPGGPQGIQGVQGERGLIGPIGPLGPIGPQGTQGVQGFGLQGRQGVQGVQGIQGFGLQGVQGVQGTQGFGLQGPQGLTGESGSMQISSTVVNGTSGSVLFVGTNGTLGQDNSKFYWDNTQKQLAIGTNTLEGFVTFVNSKPASPSFILKNAQSQTADQFRILNYNGTITYMAMDATGQLGLGLAPESGVRFSTTCDNTMHGIRVKNTGSGKNPLEIQNTIGNTVHVGPAGNLFVGSPAQGVASNMGTLHVSQNNSIGGSSIIVAQHSSSSPASTQSVLEAREVTGVVFGLWDYRGNMILGSGNPRPNSRLSLLPSVASSVPNLFMQASDNTSNPLMQVYTTSGTQVIQINNGGDIIPGPQGIRFGYDPQNSQGGKIGFYNATAISQPQSGDLLTACKNLGLVGSAVTTPGADLAVTRSTGVVTVSNNYTVTESGTVFMILCDGTPGADIIHIYLPNAANVLGRVIAIKNLRSSNSGLSVKIHPVASQYIESYDPLNNFLSEDLTLQFQSRLYIAVNNGGQYWWYRIGGTGD